MPCPSAKAIVTTSREPKTAPVARNVTRSGGSSGRRRGERGRPVAGAGATGGSVRRWAAKSSTPVSSSAAATAVPASGKRTVHSSVASTGPSMKHSSSAACSKELAVCRAAGSSRKRCAQRARDIPPVLGVVAVAA